MDPSPDMAAYFRLAIEIGRAHLGWLAQRLGALGFPAFEEQQQPGGVRLLIYDQSRERLAAVQRELGQGGAPVPLHSSLEVAPRDWALRWTEYLEPIQLTPALTLIPSAEAAPPAPGALYLEPAFAFGFGEHASTRLLASWVEAQCSAHAGRSLLDVGCGTGVLALVALKSGAGHALGVDVSEPAVRSARANAMRNSLTARFEQRSASELDERFDLVVANIEAGVLLEASASIVRCLGAASQLGLAGFIEEQEAELVQHYLAHGVVLQRVAQEGDWCLLAGGRLVTGRR